MVRQLFQRTVSPHLTVPRGLGSFSNNESQSEPRQSYVGGMQEGGTPAIPLRFRLASASYVKERKSIFWPMGAPLAWQDLARKLTTLSIVRKSPRPYVSVQSLE